MNNTTEEYGDIHLHYDGYPSDFTTKSPVCKWTPFGKAPYDPYTPEVPLYDRRCHVEYCHPGTWQGDCDCKKTTTNIVVPAAMTMAPAQPISFLDEIQAFLNNLFKMDTLYYVGALVLVIAFVFYVLRLRSNNK